MYKCAVSLIFSFALLVGLTTAADARRVALVIGNSDYTHASTLPNPANDARDIAGAFSSLGYETQLVEDAARGELMDALRTFRARSLGADHSVIYYAGHGIEIDRQNFVVPVDAVLKADIDVEYEAVPMELLVAATSGARNLQLVVLDACRDNPFLSQMTRTLSTRNIGRGLALYEPDGNSLVAYSAREGTVALDGTGQNSPYAMAFLSALKQPQLEIGQFFREVRDSVIQQTNGQQEPFLYGSLSAQPVFFQPPQATASVTPAPTVPAARPSSEASTDTLLSIDLAFWQSIEDSTQTSDFEDYLSRFPDGLFRPLAQRRLAALKAPEGQARSSAVEDTIPAVSAPAPQPKPEAVAAPRPVETPNLISLSRSQTRDLQARLNLLGFRAGGEDGIAGRRTLQAANGYRSARGMAAVDGIDSALVDRITDEVPAARLAAYRDAQRTPAPKPTEPTKTAKPKATTQQAAKPAAKPAPKPAASAGNLAGYVGRSYCRKRDGIVLNGRNLSDRPIWCVEVLSLNASQIRYRVLERQQAGRPLNRSTFTRSRTGNRTYGSVKLAASGSGSMVVNGSTFVASSYSR